MRVRSSSEPGWDHDFCMWYTQHYDGWWWGNLGYHLGWSGHFPPTPSFWSAHYSPNSYTSYYQFIGPSTVCDPTGVYSLHPWYPDHGKCPYDLTLEVQYLDYSWDDFAT